MTRTQALYLRQMIEKAAISLTDTDALTAVELYPKWKSGVWYDVDGKRYRYEDKLYRVRIAHASQDGWEPPNVPALWQEVEKPHQGDTPDDPIPYNNNMELIEGKYYEQLDVTYHCIRSTEVPVYNNLADLVGIYVEVYEPI